MLSCCSGITQVAKGRRVQLPARLVLCFLATLICLPSLLCVSWDHEIHLLSAATDFSLPDTTKSLGQEEGFGGLGEGEVLKQSRMMIALKHTDSPLSAKGIFFHPAWRQERNSPANYG